MTAFSFLDSRTLQVLLWPCFLSPTLSHIHFPDFQTLVLVSSIHTYLQVKFYEVQGHACILFTTLAPIYETVPDTQQCLTNNLLNKVYHM